MRRLRVRRELADGHTGLTLERLPRLHGLAWYDFERGVAVCYPIPLNVAAAWCRRAWLFLAFRAIPRPTEADYRILQAFTGGYARGEREGYRHGYHDGLSDASRALKKGGGRV